jgi:hypothetical protein
MKRQIVYIAFYCLFIQACSNRTSIRSPYETQCVQPPLLKIVIFKETDSVLKATEANLDAKYPHDLENLLGENLPDNMQIRRQYDSSIQKYKRFEKQYDDSLFVIIAVKHRITNTCLDSIWWEGAKESWHNMDIHKSE